MDNPPNQHEHCHPEQTPPPNETKNLWLLIIGLMVLVGAVFVFKNISGGSLLIWNLSNEGTRLLPLVSIAALIDSINPCAFSILLVTIAFLFSIGKLRKKILTIGLTYILGIFLVYIFIGLGLLQVLHIFNTPHFMGKLGAGILIAFGLINIINEFFPRFPVKLKIPSAAHGKIAELMNRISLPTAFILGALVGLCEFPCTGGPYLMVIGLLRDTATYAKGFGYLLLYNIIFVLPLVIILFIASNRTLLDKVQTWQKQERTNMRLFGGVAMILLGLIIFLM